MQEEVNVTIDLQLGNVFLQDAARQDSSRFIRLLRGVDQWILLFFKDSSFTDHSVDFVIVNSNVRDTGGVSHHSEQGRRRSGA